MASMPGIILSIFQLVGNHKFLRYVQLYLNYSMSRAVSPVLASHSSNARTSFSACALIYGVHLRSISIVL
jgi:hypothetical protein